jgi:hypothetical protein
MTAIESEDVGRVARALAKRHYESRFGCSNQSHIQMNVDGNWGTFSDDARAAIAAMPVPYPSLEAMMAAVELEIHSALGRVQTVVIGQMIQKAIDAAMPASPMSDFERAFTDACDEIGCAHDNEALLQAIADLKAAMPGWHTIDDCPSDGSDIWMFGGRHESPCQAKADGDWWRYETKHGGKLLPTHWMPFRVPAPPDADPEGGR